MEDTRKTDASRSVLDIVSRRRGVAGITLLVGIFLSIAIAILVRPYYDGTAHVLLVNDQQGRDPSSEGLDMPTIATSTTVLDSVRSKLNLDIPIGKLRKNVTVRVAPKSSLMTIVAKDHDPNRSIAITNAVADTFVSFYGSVTKSRYEAVIQQLRTDLAARRTRLLSLESRLQQNASTSSYVGSQTSLDNTASALNELVTQRTFAYAQLVSDDAELSSNRSTPSQLAKIVRHETLANDQIFHQLEIQVSHDQANFAIHKASYTDNFPGLAGEQAKVDSEKAALNTSALTALNGPAAYSPSLGGQIVAEQKAAASVAGDIARVKALDSQIRETRNKLATVPASGMNAGALRALRDTEEAQFQALALRLSSAQANSAEANSLGSVVVIDRAETAEPNILSTNLLLALCLLVSLLAAVAAAYLSENANPRLISADDIQSTYGRPVLGSLDAP